MSASDTGDFLRLARSWLRIVAASGVNFLETVAAGAKFCFSSDLLSYRRQYATALGNRLWKR